MGKETANIAISKEVHLLLVAHIQETDGKIGKFTEKAIKEKIAQGKSCNEPDHFDLLPDGFKYAK